MEVMISMNKTMESATSEAITKEGIEIKGKDVIRLNAPEVLLSPDTPLLTEAQDIAGAINELFQYDPEGGDEEWQPPDDWIPVPEPGPNEIYLLVETTPKNNWYYASMADPETGREIYEDITIDWGDGTFSSASGRHYYQEPGQYLIHIYSDKYTLFLGSTNWNSPAVLLIAKLGSDISVYFDDTQTKSTFNGQYKLRYIKINNPNITTLTENFANCCYALCRFDMASKIKILKNYAFYFCCNLTNVDFSETETLPGSALVYSGIKQLELLKCTSIGGISNMYSLKKIYAPLCETILNNACMGDYRLAEIYAPLCTNVGSSAFQQNYSLSKATFSENCVFGKNCFDMCYNLYPHPDESTN